MSTKDERIRELEKQIGTLTNEPDQAERDAETARRLREAAQQQKGK